MNILVACEESQAVTIELRKLGHNAFSCDIIECSGGHPEWHVKQDVLPLLNGCCNFETQAGHKIAVCYKWDMIIAFPPCTDLCVSGARWFKEKRANGTQQKSIEFFKKFASADCEKIVIENPVGIMSSELRKPEQIIQPWMFGDMATKTTCLWLKGVSKLVPKITIQPELEYHYMPNGNRMQKWMYDIRCMDAKSGKRAKEGSKTFPGIAKAMAEQFTK